MVFVNVPEHHQFAVVEGGTDMVGHQRSIEGCTGLAATNQHLVAVRVLAAAVAKVDGDATEVAMADGVLGVFLSGHTGVHFARAAAAGDCCWTSLLRQAAAPRQVCGG